MNILVSVSVLDIEEDACPGDIGDLVVAAVMQVCPYLEVELVGTEAH